MMKNNKLLIFVHIPKTAGTTVRGIINRQYGKHCYEITKTNISHLLSLPQCEKDDIKVLQGHRVFGFHKYFTLEATYITMLRDPVERVISSYYYNLLGLNASSNEIHEKIIKNNYTLKDYVHNGISPNIENHHVRLLSGNIDIPHISCTIEMLKTAKKNIDEQFELVGITEYFDEFLIMLMLELGWKFPFYWKRNVTHNRPRKEDIDKETLKVIEKYNQLDIDLYQYAKEKFENRLEEMDDTFYKKLETFRKINPYFKIPGEIKNYIASIYRKFYRR